MFASLKKSDQFLQSGGNLFGSALGHNDLEKKWGLFSLTLGTKAKQSFLWNTIKFKNMRT